MRTGEEYNYNASMPDYNTSMDGGLGLQTNLVGPVVGWWVAHGVPAEVDLCVSLVRSTATTNELGADRVTNA